MPPLKVAIPLADTLHQSPSIIPDIMTFKERAVSRLESFIEFTTPHFPPRP
jgi:hypothetical protein